MQESAISSTLNWIVRASRFLTYYQLIHDEDSLKEGKILAQEFLKDFIYGNCCGEWYEKIRITIFKLSVDDHNKVFTGIAPNDFRSLCQQIYLCYEIIHCSDIYEANFKSLCFGSNSILRLKHALAFIEASQKYCGLKQISEVINLTRYKIKELEVKEFWADKVAELERQCSEKQIEINNLKLGVTLDKEILSNEFKAKFKSLDKERNQFRKQVESLKTEKINLDKEKAILRQERQKLSLKQYNLKKIRFSTNSEYMSQDIYVQDLNELMELMRRANMAIRDVFNPPENIYGKNWWLSRLRNIRLAHREDLFSIFGRCEEVVRFRKNLSQAAREISKYLN